MTEPVTPGSVPEPEAPQPEHPEVPKPQVPDPDVQPPEPDTETGGPAEASTSDTESGEPAEASAADTESGEPAEASAADTGPGEPSEGAEEGHSEAAISEPGKVMRIGTMAKQLLEEVRNMELDEAGRVRLAEIHRRTLDELSEGMSADLVDELKRLDMPFDADATPTSGELRLAQAQLVGWLEGLFHGIQTAIMAQQTLAQQASGRGELPPGMTVVPQDPTETGAQQASRDDGHSGTGNYL